MSFFGNWFRRPTPLNEIENTTMSGNDFLRQYGNQRLFVTQELRLSEEWEPSRNIPPTKNVTVSCEKPPVQLSAIYSSVPEPLIHYPVTVLPNATVIIKDGNIHCSHVHAGTPFL